MSLATSATAPNPPAAIIPYRRHAYTPSITTSASSVPRESVRYTP